MEDFALEPPRDAGIRSKGKMAEDALSSRSGEEQRRDTSSGAGRKGPASRSTADQALKPRARQQRQTKKRVFALLAEVKVANQDLRFVQALGAFREAATLSQGSRSLREIAFATAVEEAEHLLKENWRVAAAFLDEVSLLNLDRAFPKSIGLGIDRATREECISNILSTLASGEDLPETHTRLQRAIRLYPGEAAALESHLEAVTAALAGNPAPANNQDVTEHGPQSAGPISVPDETAQSNNPADAADACDQAGAVAAVKALLENGPLSQAEKACKEAVGKFPHSRDLWVLAAAIREKEEEVRRLLEKGEENLARWNLAAARDSFLQASRLVPLDHELRGSIADKLHARARTELENDWRTSEALLALSGRISPGCFIPPDLAQALEERKRHASPEQASPEAPQSSGAFVDVEVLTYAEGSVPPPHQRRPRRSPAADALIDVDPHPVRRVLKRVAAYGVLLTAVAAVATTFVVWRPFQRAAKAPTRVYEIPPVSAKAAIGTLTIRSNVADAQVFINSKKYVRPQRATEFTLKLPVDTYLVYAASPGYIDSAPVIISVLTDTNRAVNLHLDPKPASLEIRGAAPDTQIKVDGVLWGAVTSGANLVPGLPPGTHTIELSRAGYQEKTIARQFAPGETAVLTGDDVALLSAARPLSAPTDDRENLLWPYVDRNDPEVLQSFLSKYPNGVHSAEARQQLQVLSAAKPNRAEKTDWDSTDKRNRLALRNFLVKHPAGAHAAQAASLIADLERRRAANHKSL